MRTIFSVIIFLCSIGAGLSQELKKVPLLKEDSLNNVIDRYEYIGEDGRIVLLLKENKSYDYSLNTHLYARVSEGTWKKDKKVIILKSSIQKENLPVSINYGDAGTFEDGFKISVVKNIKGEFIPSFVLINNDSLKCDPSLGFCNGTYESIQRVKVLLENGISSKWINVEKPGEKIILTIITEQPLLKYTVMENEKYNIKKGGLILEKVQ